MTVKYIVNKLNDISEVNQTLLFADPEHSSQEVSSEMVNKIMRLLDDYEQYLLNMEVNVP